MRVDRIRLEGFRNYGLAETDFSDGINIISGENAQGKTNLLEAVFYLTAGRSFRARSDSEITTFGRDHTAIKADLTADERAQDVLITFGAGKRKSIVLNGVKLKNSAELAGNFTSVLFCPDDLALIKTGAAARRRLMNMCISQLRPRYAAALLEFSRVYQGKTRILRDAEEKPSLLELLDEYNVRLARMSAELIHYRAAFAKTLSREAGAIHAAFSGGRETLEIKYKTVSTIRDPEIPVDGLYELIMEHQRAHKTAEIASRLCLTGAHKDDLEIFINGEPAREYASQGQARTAALSMKLAEREIHYSARGEYPVLLLDDVLSELDAGRQNFILNCISGGQVFITCCEDGEIAKKTGGRVMYVKNGAFYRDK